MPKIGAILALSILKDSHPARRLHRAIMTLPPSESGAGRPWPLREVWGVSGVSGTTGAIVRLDTGYDDEIGTEEEDDDDGFGDDEDSDGEEEDEDWSAGICEVGCLIVIRCRSDEKW